MEEKGVQVCGCAVPKGRSEVIAAPVSVHRWLYFEALQPYPPLYLGPFRLVAYQPVLENEMGRGPRRTGGGAVWCGKKAGDFAATGEATAGRPENGWGIRCRKEA